ncbi:fimbrial protein [Salmonella enterica]
MNKHSLLMFLIIANTLTISSAQADYIGNIDFNVMSYNLSAFTIPATVGEANSNWHDNGSVHYSIYPSSSTQTYVTLSVDGSLLGDGVTWATSNPGIGIQYKLNPQGCGAFTPQDVYTAPDYRSDLVGNGGAACSSYLHLRYRLVRLLETVPPGEITTLPKVTLNAYNLAGDGPSELSGLILSGVRSQPQITPCTINAPSEIILPPINGNSLVNGAQGITDAPKITLTNCPGAINGITYDFAATYFNTCGASQGIFCTQQGEGYANGVNIQIQNADGSAHRINGSIPIANYIGSGDYDIPDFKVAYYISDKDVVTAGKVASAIDLTVSYN